MEQTAQTPRKRRWGDRYDGRRIRSLAPFYQIIPYIMKTRVDSQVYFEDQVNIDHLESWLREQRRLTGKELGYLHVFVAAVVRTMSQKPRLNRFVAGRRIYARNQITISFVIKKSLSEDSPGTTVKLNFDPRDTFLQIADKMHEAVTFNRVQENSNDTDKTAWLFMLCPSFLIKFLVWFLDRLDHIGLMPKAIHHASPFHTSCFITNMGSLGIKPIYHHIYEFGSTSNFIAFGHKLTHREIDFRGQVVERKTIDIKVVADERICDGHYYASSFRYLMGLFKRPEVLLNPPERVVEDAD